MPKFKIGDRVRILPTCKKSWAVGKTGKIKKYCYLDDIRHDNLDWIIEYDVLLDDADETKPPYGRVIIRAEDLELETDIWKEKNNEESDPVNHPSHYTDGKYEVIDFIESRDYMKDFRIGNAVKYICRAGKKNPDKEKEDIQKAIWYLDRYQKERSYLKDIPLDDFLKDKGFHENLKGVALELIYQRNYGMAIKVLNTLIGEENK